MSSPQPFGPYSLVNKIATGGMAEVWLARKSAYAGVEQRVVIKRILPQLAEDPEFVQLFLNEARIAARFTHPNIAQIYDVGEHGGTYFIAMEYVHGEDLGRVLRANGGRLPPHLALRIVADACQGLHYAHSRTDEQGRPLRVVHRDVSPQNILLTFDGSVKLVDFGIARAADQAAITRQGTVRGKLLYMAPEQAAGEPLDARTDLFAMGLVLYELLTGARPLKRETEAASLHAVLEARVSPPSAFAPDLPRALDELVMRALRKAPAERYATGRDFQRAIEEYLLGTRTLATSAEVAELMAKLFPGRRAGDVRPPGQAPPDRPPAVASVETRPITPGHPATPAQLTTPATATPTKAPTSAPRSGTTPIVYRHTVEAFFGQVLTRRGLLTPGLVEQLRAVGVDPARLRDVEFETWWKVLPLAAQALSPGRPPDDAFRELGREVLRGYEASFVGKTSFLALRLLGVKRAVTKLTDSFRTTDNVTQAETTHTGPRSARVRFVVPGGLPYPTYTQGVLLEGMSLLGAKDAKAPFQVDPFGALVFDVSWS